MRKRWSRSTRVVEEFGSRKTASDRTETVSDSVCKTEFELEDAIIASLSPGVAADRAKVRDSVRLALQARTYAFLPAIPKLTLAWKLDPCALPAHNAHDPAKLSRYAVEQFATHCRSFPLPAGCY